MMLDEEVVAVAPSSVHRVLQAAGLSSRWTVAPGEVARQGFVQPTRPHEQWHTAIAYLNILGTHYFFLGVLDGYSRSIVHHEVRTDMTTGDVEIVVERALETLPPEQGPPHQPAPRLITDNGAQYVSAECRGYLRERDSSHSRARARHPQSNGKMERFHKSLKRECLRVQPMSNLAEARALALSRAALAALEAAEIAVNREHQVHYNHYLVCRAQGLDDEARSALARAYQVMQALAEGMSPEPRKAFLEGVRVNREIADDFSAYCRASRSCRKSDQSISR